MSKKGTKALASATLMSLVLTTALSAGPVKAAAGQVTRTSGLDRYATAASVATANWTTSETVVLVNGDNYPDAVSASALAKKLNAPILLTKAADLNADTKAALEKLGAKKVYVVGGEASVSSAIRTDLKANYSLVELGGKDRYATNVAVANELVKLGVDASNVLLVGGEGFSDALSVAPVAAAKGQILLLGNNSEDSMKSVIDFVTANKSKVTVVGTSNVISEDMFKALGAVERVNGGANRFETNMNVLNKFATDLKADKLFVANASGNGFADALVASALAGKTASPLVLVDTEGSDATAKAVDYIKTKATQASDLNVIGGVGVVADSTVTAINNAVNPTTPVENNQEVSVKSVEAVNLNEIKVVFSGEVDKDSAKNEANYKIDGTALNNTNAIATLGDDNKTVTIKLSSKIDQDAKKYIKVDGVLAKDTLKRVAAVEQQLQFKDSEIPTVASVEVVGNKKIKVAFSEVVNLTNPTVDLKINGVSLSSFGGSATVVDPAPGTKYSDKLELNFTTALPSGSTNKITFPAGTAGTYEDVAGFRLAEVQVPFTVDSVTDAPVIQNVTASNNGKVTVTFNREMQGDNGTNGVLNVNNFNIGGVKPTNVEATVDNKYDKVDLTFATGTIVKGSNVLVVTKDMKDVYGNKLDKDNDVRYAFSADEDKVKPEVSSVEITQNDEDLTKITVKFSEDVDYAYATSLANYKLKDSTGSTKLDKSTNNTLATITNKSNDTKNSDTYIITITNSGTAFLNGGNYTLNVKNIQDIAKTPNIMDEVTKDIVVADTVSPTIQANSVMQAGNEYKVSDNAVALRYSEKMATSGAGSILSASNYRYQNANGEWKSLPSGASVTEVEEGRTVVIKASSSDFAIGNVKKIRVINVTDLAGNLIQDGISEQAVATNAANAAKVAIDRNTIKVDKDGDDVVVTFDTKEPLSQVDTNDITYGGVNPSKATISGKTVTLTFSNDTVNKADLVKAAGSGADLTIASAANSMTSYGKLIADFNDVAEYHNLAPQILDKSDVKAVGTNQIAITFSSPIDSTIVTDYKDDFKVIANGTSLDVQTAAIDTDGRTLILTFASNITGTATIRANSDASKINIREIGLDDDGSKEAWLPSDDDKSGYTVTFAQN